jgi:hypothetical protein
VAALVESDAGSGGDVQSGLLSRLLVLKLLHLGVMLGAKRYDTVECDLASLRNRLLERRSLLWAAHTVCVCVCVCVCEYV